MSTKTDKSSTDAPRRTPRSKDAEALADLPEIEILDETPDVPDVPDVPNMPNIKDAPSSETGADSLASGEAGAEAPASSKRRPSVRLWSEIESEAETETEGVLTFDRSIVEEIAHREASKMAGIVHLSGGFMDGWMKNRAKGIKVEETTQESYTLRLNVFVEYGTSCPELFKSLQKNIAAVVKHHTGKSVERIDIHVAGIKDVAPVDEPDEDDGPFGEELGIGF